MTEIAIGYAKGVVNHQFNLTKEEFMEQFNNQVAGCGYATFVSDEDITVIINPSNCSFIEVADIG